MPTETALDNAHRMFTSAQEHKRRARRERSRAAEEMEQLRKFCEVHAIEFSLITGKEYKGNGNSGNSES